MGTILRETVAAQKARGARRQLPTAPLSAPLFDDQGQAGVFQSPEQPLNVWQSQAK
jgi:hypothetical protein